MRECNINPVECKDGKFQTTIPAKELSDIQLNRIKKKILADMEESVKNMSKQEPAPSEVTVTVNIY